MNKHRQTLIDLFTVSIEKLREFKHLTALDRLNWLADASEMRHMAVTQDKRDVWDAYMRKYNVPG